MIKLIVIGQLKEKYLKEAVEEYKKRISKYTNIEIIELKDEGLVEDNKAIELEGEKIRNIQIEYPNISFIIGGSNGLSNEIKELSNYHLSFSKMTFPHQLIRVFLLEQIYRAFKISKNETYHW